MTPLVRLLLCLAPQEWPQYNGPAGDRVAPGALEAAAFPAGGPKVVWREELGPGFSSFVVANGRAFTLVTRSGRETLVALDAATGDERWARPLSKADYDGGADAGTDENKGGDGPRTTPAVVGGRVFVLDAQLLLAAFDAGTGEELWRHDLVAEQDAQPIRWQNGASPLVDGELVFAVGGGKGRALLAFRVATGELAWAKGTESMTHATPIAATVHGVRQVIFFVQSGLVAVEPASGNELWRTEFPYKVSTAASPVVSGDVVYCSAGYGVGAAAWRLKTDGGALVPELLWRTSNKNVNHWSTPVAKDGHLYGLFSFKEYGDGPLACIDLGTGEQVWEQEGFGPGNLIRAGDALVVLSDAGELVLVDATPEAYRERARAEVLSGKCWSTPAFDGAALFLRSTSEGARIALR